MYAGYNEMQYAKIIHNNYNKQLSKIKNKIQVTHKDIYYSFNFFQI
jgi:hypothetical protein